MVDGLLNVDDATIEVDSVELREEMQVSSRRTFAGVYIFCGCVHNRRCNVHPTS